MRNAVTDVEFSPEALMGEFARREDPVARAMLLFWQDGAEVAAYPDIVKATGLSRKSLYRRWADKEALVAETLAYYRREMLSTMIEPLQTNTHEGLVRFWQQVELSAKMDGWRGCYLFRSASGPMRERPYVAAAVNAYLDELNASFEACISDGVTRKFLPSDTNSRRSADMSVALLATISTLGAQAGYSTQIARFFDAAWSLAGATAPS